MSKFVIALFTAMLIAVIGGVVVPAEAHDCGCQVDNSGPGSSSSGTGSDNSGSGSTGPDNSGPGNACHDNSGPGSTGPDNSGPGNAADDECPPADPGDDPGDSGDGAGNDSNNTGDQATAGNVVVQGAQASAGSSSPTQAGGSVPSAVNAGLTEREEPPSALAALMILLGLAMTCVALGRRRTRV